MAWAARLLRKARAALQLVEDFAEDAGGRLDQLEAEAAGVLPLDEGE